MTTKLLLIVSLLFLQFTSIAQKQLSDVETQNFFRLIRQTKEYATCKGRVDSANKAIRKDQVPQEIKLDIVTRQQNLPTDDNIFEAVLERRLAVGLALDTYFFQYDRHRKQIISTKYEKGRFQMN